jgi:hypothetical protein
MEHSQITELSILNTHSDLGRTNDNSWDSEINLSFLFRFTWSKVAANEESTERSVPSG